MGTLATAASAPRGGSRRSGTTTSFADDMLGVYRIEMIRIAVLERNEPLNNPSAGDGSIIGIEKTHNPARGRRVGLQ
jgi:hypothetical protein